MSEYANGVEELDCANQNTTTPKKIKGVGGNTNIGLSDNNKSSAAAHQVPKIVRTKDLTEIPSSSSNMSGTKATNISGAQATDAQATNVSSTAVDGNVCSSSIIARKAIDIVQLKEKTNATLTDIKEWQQYRWQCFLCTHSCDFFRILLNHLRDCHNIVADDDIRYQCSDCGRVIHEYCQFINHIRQDHHSHLKTSCDVCSRTFDSYDTLATHRQKTHTECNNLRPKVFNCNQCELTFATKNEVDDHCVHHIWICSLPTSNGSLRLEEVDKPNNINKYKIQHSVHEKQNKNFSDGFVCDCCNKKFSAREDYWSHLSEHANELPHKCTTCVARFRTQNECVTHIQGHQLLVCKYCPNISLTAKQYSSHFNSHISSRRIEKSSKIWSCNKCGKKFQNHLALTKHTKFACLRHSFTYRIPTKPSKQSIT